MHGPLDWNVTYPYMARGEVITPPPFSTVLTGIYIYIYAAMRHIFQADKQKRCALELVIACNQKEKPWIIMIAVNDRRGRDKCS